MNPGDEVRLEKIFIAYLLLTVFIFAVSAYQHMKDVESLDKSLSRVSGCRHALTQCMNDNGSCGMKATKLLNEVTLQSQEIADLEENRESLNSLLSEAQAQRDLYKVDLGLCNKLGDSLLMCGETEDQGKRDSCYLDISKRRYMLPRFLLLSICDEIQNQSVRDICYLNAAVNKGDAGICGRIEYLNFVTVTCCSGETKKRYYRDECYKILAVIREDPQLCGEIRAQDTRDACYLKLALEQQDPSICEKIQGECFKSQCASIN